MGIAWLPPCNAVRFLTMHARVCSSANNTQQKMYNWNTLNQKVLKRLGFAISKQVGGWDSGPAASSRVKQKQLQPRRWQNIMAVSRRVFNLRHSPSAGHGRHVQLPTRGSGAHTEAYEGQDR